MYPFWWVKAKQKPEKKIVEKSKKSSKTIKNQKNMIAKKYQTSKKNKNKNQIKKIPEEKSQKTSKKYHPLEWVNK